MIDVGDGHRVTVKPKAKDPMTFDVIRDECADIVTHAQVREMAPKYGLDPDKREEFDEALNRLRRMTLETAYRNARAAEIYAKQIVGLRSGG